jgi:hypothetical protein
MFEEAKRCNACGTFQRGLRSYLPFSQTVLTLLVALIAVTSPAITGVLYLRDYYSNTKFTVAGADNLRISVKVWNTGRQPSTVTGCRFLPNGSLPITLPELDLAPEDRKDGKNVIVSREPVTLHFVATTPKWLPKAGHSEGFTRQEFQPIESQLLKMSIEVEESNSRKGSAPPEIFPVRRIREFLCGGCLDANQ